MNTSSSVPPSDEGLSPVPGEWAIRKTRTTHRRLRHTADRSARLVVWVGGIATIVSIMGIFLYLMWEVLPLFRSTSGSVSSDVHIQEKAGFTAEATIIGLDEYQEVAFVLSGNHLQFFQMPEGTSLAKEGEILHFPGTMQSAVLIGQKGNRISTASQNGMVFPLTVQFRPVFEGSTRTIVPTHNIGTPIRVMAEGEQLVRHAHAQQEEQQVIAALTSSGRLWLTKVEDPDEFSLSDETKVTQQQLNIPEHAKITHLLLDSFGKRLVAGTDQGELLEWSIRDGDETKVRRVAVGQPGDAVTALTYLNGERTLVVGTQSGQVMTWVPMDERKARTIVPFRKVFTFQAHTGAVQAISPSQRDKGFLTADNQGHVTLYHATTGQTIMEFNQVSTETIALRFSPKSNGGTWLGADGRLRTFSIDNPHPEITFQSLFFPVTYEGYEDPEHIWQSSSGSDDFEPKFGMMPLIFGTLKGTIYAMILAIPLAVMGAVYTAMFMHPHLRAVVKPSIEIMAALPSVVLGFLAGLWFAPLLEKIFPAVVAGTLLLPVTIGLVCLLWQTLPRSLAKLDTYGIDLVLIMVAVVATVGLCLASNDWIETVVFGGNYKQWLTNHLGLVYDQRNAIVISFAMGFAVIPIIFSIAEDSLSNVPKHLVAGSLALGATKWQTLTRLVLVSASPGIFSALMIGFGRAVGETMIVLMATGNTPIVDWSVFNGFRTLSANIAVEMPEAPHGGTLYRVLFLSGLILFAFTFGINTMAELIRQRLREKYSQF
ncbi:MAG: ABC transporter permease subunit [Nitrospirota bacterium]|nr:ABC transporter permease subunit [Nitrospirota bacterium]